MRLPELLQKDHDRAHARIGDKGLHIIGGCRHRLVAGRDEMAEAEPSRAVEERNADRAALHHSAHASGRQLGRQRSPEQRGLTREVEQAQAIRPADGKAVRLSEVRQLTL